MAILIVIKYRQENLNNLGPNGFKVLNELKGKCNCHFHYYEPDRLGRSLVRIDLLDKNWSLIVGYSKDEFSFCNPWIRRGNEMDAVIETNGFSEECNIIFTDFRANTINVFVENGAAVSLPDVKALIQKCKKLKKPVVSINVEKDKEIWAAYCDGLNALNKEKRELVALDKVFSPIAYNDTRKGKIYTIKFETSESSLLEIPSKVKLILKKDYNIGTVELSEDKRSLVINFKGIEKIADDDLEKLDSIMAEFGFSSKKDSKYNVIKATLCWKRLKDRGNELASFEQKLEEKGIVFSNDENLHYILTDDKDSASFEETVKDCLNGILPFKITEVLVPIAKDNFEKVVDLIEGKDFARIQGHKLVVQANNQDNYNENVSLLVELFLREGILLDFPDYHPTYILRDKEMSIEDRKKRLLMTETKIDEIVRLASKRRTDETGAYAFQYDFHFISNEEREYILQQLNIAKESIAPKHNIVIKDRIGFTQITYTFDPLVVAQLNEELKANYQGEEVALLNGRVYRQLFDKIEDIDNITDNELREKYNRFMQEYTIIGICHKRTWDSIIVELDEEFYDGETMKQIIHNGDYVFFPSVGTSTEIRRQVEAMLRINKPGQKMAGGRIIDYPVNAKLCSFLFNPLFARTPTRALREVEEDIRRTCIEKHLNDKQIEAVAKSIIAPDIAFIQGPPGTGKTTVIAEIIWQLIRRNPHCRILLTSQTNLAVDNALERLKYKPSIRPIRIISGDKERDEELRYNANIIEAWATRPDKSNNDNVVNTIIENIIKRIKNNTDKLEDTKEWLEELESRGTSIRRLFVEEYKAHTNLVAATCSICGSYMFSQIYAKMYNQERVEFDVVIMDEASKATPLEMAVPMVLGKKIIVIGDHKQLPPMLDENSLDTMLKKIGREDLATRIQELKESQFKKLFLQAQKFRPELITTLDTQYRMHKKIMQTITHFYEEELGERGLICGIEDVMDNPDMQVRGSRFHGIEYEPFLSKTTHAIWVNVTGNEQQERTSYKNLYEVNAIRTIIKALTMANGFKEYIHSRANLEDKEIGLITFYSAQKRELKQLVNNNELNPLYDYRVDVVDRFQGMERNIVIVSTVRSNAWNGIGFAKEIERINVAFSRARTLLIVVGNRDMFVNKYNYKSSIAAMEKIEIRQIEDLIRHHHE